MGDDTVTRGLPSYVPLKLIMVVEHDERIGTRLVQMIRHETPFQAILATNLSEAQSLLLHLACDWYLLADDTCMQEELERLPVLAPSATPPTVINLTFLASTYHYRDTHDMKSIVRTVSLLLSVISTSPRLSLGEQRSEKTGAWNS